MAKRVSRSRVGSVMVGRILSFDRLKGYGFIRTVDGEDILFSSYGVSKSIWRKISIGDYVQFTVGKSDSTGNSAVATNVVIIKKMPKNLNIMMPNCEFLEVRHIYRFGKNSLLKDGYGKVYPDYPPESFDYVFIKTPKRTFIFNRRGSPVVIDGETDIDEFYEYLNDLLIKYDVCSNYES